MKREDVMKKFHWNVLVIVCSLGLILIVLESTGENNAFGAEIEFSEELLSQTVAWEKCELFDTQTGWRKAECADITVPLYWDNPEGETMKIHVKRLKALLKATKQMWFLAGGPGVAGTSGLPQYMKIIAQQDWRTDLYTLDHRGTGYSNRLGCPDQEADDSEEGFTISTNEWNACIDHLEANYSLDAFTATQAAKDVGFLVELLSEGNKEIFVYGRSYGTYLAHRYAQIFPEQAYGVILESVDPPINNGWDQFDILANDVLKDFFEICKGDAFCRSKMGEDPWGKANDIFEKFKDGHCPEASEYGLTPEFLQLGPFGLLDWWNLRIVIPALYYRLDRCSEKDVNVFRHMMDNAYPLFYPEEVSFSDRQDSNVLMHHIGLSEEINENPISAEDMEEIDKTLLATSHSSYKFLQLLEEGWPTYATDDYYRKWASKDVPILMLVGTLDQRAPIAMSSVAEENLNGPNQYFVEIPNGNHFLMWDGSPVKNIFAPDCGTQIILDYMEDPLSEPDTSCLANLMPINFRGNPLIALVLFGTLDIWENNVNTSLTNDQISLMDEEAERTLHDLRERLSQ